MSCWFFSGDSTDCFFSSGGDFRGTVVAVGVVSMLEELDLVS